MNKQLFKLIGLGILIMGTIFIIIMTPFFISMGSPEALTKGQGTIGSIVIASVFFAIFLFLLIYQGAKGVDITKEKWWVKIFGV